MATQCTFKAARDLKLEIETEFYCSIILFAYYDNVDLFIQNSHVKQ